MIHLEPFEELDCKELGARAQKLIDQLFPLCRSITGQGLRDTFQRLQEEVQIEVTEVPTGKKCFDWTVPKEWIVSDAYIKDQNGVRVVDFKQSNLHLVNYSTGIGPSVLSFNELRPHLHTLPNLPKAIPYRTSYYQESWGFCLSEDSLQAMDTSADYEVYIDAELVEGSLSIAHSGVDAKAKPQVLFSTYCCHPSMGNDNLSGVVMTSLLQSRFSQQKTNIPVAFAYVPETIGALALLSEFSVKLDELLGAFVVSCVGGPGATGWKCSFQGDSIIDRAVQQSFREMELEPVQYPFRPDGSDERQYSSPAFRIPCVSVCKDKYYEYEYYHTSLDDLDFLKVSSVLECLQVYWSALEKIDRNVYVLSKNPSGELQLGKRGLYPQLGGSHRQPSRGESFEQRQVDVLSWLMFFADGETSLLDMSERTDFSFRDYLTGLKLLLERELVEISMEPL